MRAAQIAARVGFLLFFIATSIYCLLTYIPFTWEQLVKPEVFRPLAAFAHFHAWFYLAVVAVAIATMTGEMGRNRILAVLFGFLGAGAIILFVHPLLPSLGGTFSGYTWSLVALLPVVAWPLVAWKPVLAAMPEDATFDSTRGFHAAWQAGIVAAMLSATVAWMRGGGSSLPFVLLWSLPAHLMISMGIFVLVQWIWAVAASFRRARRVELVLIQVMLAVFLSLIVRGVLASSTTFSGPLAEVYAAVLAVGISAFWAIVIAPSDARLPAWKVAIALVVIGVCAVMVTIRIAPIDGNFVMQKLIGGASWLAAFLVLYRRPLPMPKFRIPAAVALAIAVLPAIGFRVLEASPLYMRDDRMLSQQAGFNPTFRLIRDLLAVSVPDGDSEYYRFLARNTNIPRSVSVAPVSVDLVDHLEAASGPKPNIFMFVVDSLRRDYLAPYNPSVHFTPNIADFAGDAIAFDNAFTRYGATGLAEPSIWVGGMMLHKQYVTPFAPMNSLEKLLKADDYDVLLSRDSILATIVGSDWGGLDQSRANMNYRMCTTLSEIEERLGSRNPSAAKPLFVYTQPQDIHISVIQREGAKPVGSGPYDGFYAPYSSRVERLDTCFGEFIQFLKKQHLYDESIIVLTSDHGDSLGEDGHWGHAYTIYPEVLRIPLIVHLPAQLRSRIRYDPSSLAFSADITPSLYALLGHAPIKRNPFFGRSLFGLEADPADLDPNDASLVASSYGAVYGLLTRAGRHLYIADATEYRDYAFDLSPSPRARPVDRAEQAVARQQIQQKILEINKFYGFSSRLSQ
ncbi:MAG TPA: sulfatase-like hydrolase/transferase [Bryobacteraceae bacterium]|nr:sulfatase-like hydrolase/transferase [Bryobacteraceae bacterium]